MNRESLNLATAFGCGVVISATIAGLVVKFRYNDKSETSTVQSLSRQIQILSSNIEQLRKDVEDIKLNSQRGSPILSSVKGWDAIDAKINHIQEEIIKDYNSQLMASGQVSNVNDSFKSDDEEFFDFSEGDSNNFISNNLDSSCMEVDILRDGYSQWLENIDHYLEDTSIDKQFLFKKLEEGEAKFGEKAEIFWRKAKASHLLAIVAEKDQNEHEKKRYTFLTHELAQKAFDKDANNPECHKWLAIAIGSLSDYIGSKEKIENGFKFKEHVDRAIKLKPNDATLHHMLGRWSLEVANLTWIEKKVAATLFTKVPEATYSEALQSLLTAQKLRSEWKDNIFYISKTNLLMKRYEEALEWIEKGLQITNKGEDDELAHKRLLELKAKYGKYKPS